MSAAARKLRSRTPAPCPLLQPAAAPTYWHQLSLAVRPAHPTLLPPSLDRQGMYVVIDFHWEQVGLQVGCATARLPAVPTACRHPCTRPPAQLLAFGKALPAGANQRCRCSASCAPPALALSSASPCSIQAALPRALPLQSDPAAFAGEWRRLWRDLVALPSYQQHLSGRVLPDLANEWSKFGCMWDSAAAPSSNVWCKQRPPGW